MASADDVLVGVDGGATHTRVLVQSRGGRRLTRLDSSGSLVRPARPGAGVGALAEHVRDALRQAGCQPPAHALCCALAGAGRPEEREVLETALRAERIAAHVRVVADAQAALYDAFHDDDGILLLAGTGSIALASRAGRTARAGGWGAVMGDEGSAFAIGRAALQAVARAHDGRGPATRLTEAVLRHTGCAAPESLVAWVDRAAKADIAALARLVSDASTDPVASAILDDAADQLLDHVRALLPSAGGQGVRPPLAVAGGALAPDSDLRRRLLQRLHDEAIPVLPRDAVVDAARGALGLAAAL
ncbi:MAG: BadF/BadG/BcrA/BcrD ATPase family protein [Gemmatimonadota bacterium]|jgi:N-acetylglucosamine kinase-like BadF-type ATPase